jgi:endonuclease/exonuclease/phosphatase family metal-dependent hydrolase
MRRLAWVAALLAAPLAVRADPFAFDVLTYNIHGLPSYIALDDPPARVPQILTRAKDFGVVLLQEDFSYQAAVDTTKQQPQIWRGSGPALSLIGVGAGITTLSRFPSVGGSEAEPFGLCNGWLGAANDCLANKGWLLVRLRLPDERELDVWNTHLDAGRDALDREARRGQLDKLAVAIEARSRGRAVLVGGDFNSEWNDPADRAVLEDFAKRVDLAIAAQTPPDGWASHLDYVLVRNGSDVCIKPRAGGKDPAFVDAAGNPLSDHPAIRVGFAVDGCAD